MKRSLLTDESGAVAIITALLLPALIGVAALAVDVSYYYQVDGRLQIIADAAALAGVSAFPDTTKAKEQAVALASANTPFGFRTTTTADDVIIGNYNPATKAFTPTMLNPNAVKVNARRTTATGNPAPRFFSAIFGSDPINIQASAIATAKNPKYCLIALDNTSVANGLTASGADLANTGKVYVPNCGIYINSSRTPGALTTNGLPTVVAHDICISGSMSSDKTRLHTYAPEDSRDNVHEGLTRCPPIPDPLLGIFQVPGQDTTIFNSQKALSDHIAKFGYLCPGTYSNVVINVTSGNLVLKNSDAPECASIKKNPPDVYHLKTKSQIKVSTSGSFVTDRVMIFMDKDSVIQVTAQAKVVMTPPETGPWAGIVVAQSDAEGAKGAHIQHQIGGSSSVTIGGTWYTPGAELQIKGSGSMADTQQAGLIIARTFTFVGGSTLRLDANGGFMGPGGSAGAMLVQ